MKYSRCLLVSAALAGMVLVMGLSVNAQSLAMRINIPFDFHAGEKTLPAGTYTVQKRGEVLWISDARGNGTAVITNAIHSKGYEREDFVVFNRYGDERFLSAVCWSGYSTGRGLIESKAERRMGSLLPVESVKLAAITR